MTKAQRIILIIFWIIVLVPVFYSPLILFTVSIILLVLTIWNTISNKRKGTKWKLFFVLSPPVTLFIIGLMIGLFSYLTGNATFVYNTKHNVIKLDSYQNFDHEYRAYYTDFRGKHYGPMSAINFSYMYRGKINDYTIKLLTNVFGYQPGMYDEHIPTSEEIYKAFETDSLYVIALTDASPDFASFEFKGKKYRITNTSISDEDIESPIKCSYGALTDEFIKQKNGLEINIGKKVMEPGVAFVASMKFYPLMIVTESIYFDKNDCTEIQLIDLEREIRFAHYSIKGPKVYPCTFCYCW